jgi:hypothetical protein
MRATARRAVSTSPITSRSLIGCTGNTLHRDGLQPAATGRRDALLIQRLRDAAGGGRACGADLLNYRMKIN